ncbi:hypothetical protein M9458_053413, partial [Cirrhinus mrigala]
VEILRNQKKEDISLKFKEKDGKPKNVAAWINLDDVRLVTVSQTSMVEKNGAPSQT